MNTSTCSFNITVITTPVSVNDTICLGDSIFLGGAWQYTDGVYIDTFENVLGCDSIVHTYLATTTECYWPTEIVYVDSAAHGNNTGHTWEDAFYELWRALDVASRYLNVRYIYISTGTYYPTSGTDRAAFLLLTDSTALLGGFTGTEESAEDRDPVNNPVFISGDIGTPGDIDDNSYHLVVCPDSVQGAILDGLRLVDANANGSSDLNKSGAGILTKGGLTVVNCIFENLLSLQEGAAIISSGATSILVLEANTFTGPGQVMIKCTSGALLEFNGENLIQ